MYLVLLDGFTTGVLVLLNRFTLGVLMLFDEFTLTILALLDGFTRGAFSAFGCIYCLFLVLLYRFTLILFSVFG